MIRSTKWAAGAALIALAGAAQAQTVHKCIINGSAVYQAAACPAANEEKSLVLPPPPSQQELLDATANARLQQYQANTGTIATPAQRRYWKQATQAQSQLSESRQQAQSTPSNNCERLNQTYHEAQYRRDELSAPGTGATRAEALQRVNDEIKRTQEQASLSRCQLR
ncbi:MAG TPA: hypothetical protein VIP05_05450 [Burkholderiaceae bacterium]